MAQINKPTNYFNTVLYTGNATDNTAITGVGFQPDWLWIKCRSDADDHPITDSVRGVTKFIFTNNSNAEATTTARIKSLDSDGFTLGTAGDVNTNTRTYASWNWLASNTTASNTDGSITSTVSANTTSGFSIVSYTGTGANATVGHGLGSKPKFIIIKSRDKVDDWHCYNETIGATKVIWLNLTSAPASTSTFMQDTEPTSSVFSLGTNTAVNTSGFDHIAYCFAEKKGFSKFGSYTGNGSADGTFVYTGFKPAMIIVKRTDSTADWVIMDNKRNPFNLVEKYLDANTSDAEADDAGGSGSWELDFVSNGFKLKENSSGLNQSGGSYIYMAFAESPLVGTNNIPAVAR